MMCYKKYIAMSLYFFNSVVLACGLFLFYMHTYRTIRYANLAEITKQVPGKIELSPVIAIICAIILIFISCLAFYGIRFYVTAILVGYSATLLLFILIHMVITAIMFFKYVKATDDPDSMKRDLKRALFVALILLKQSGSSKLLDSIQTQFKCCGVFSSADYDKVIGRTPDSCCEAQSSCTAANSYQTTCADALYDLQIKQGLVYANVHLVVFISEVIAVILSFFLVLYIESKAQIKTPEHRGLVTGEIPRRPVRPPTDRSQPSRSTPDSKPAADKPASAADKTEAEKKVRKPRRTRRDFDVDEEDDAPLKVKHGLTFK